MDLARSRITTTLVLATCGAIAVASVAAASPVSAIVSSAAQVGVAELDGDPDAAAGWLAGQFADGQLSYYGSTSWGVTADGILALTSRKVAGTVATAATDALAANVLSYISPSGGSTRSAGGVAKAALVAQVQGRDATSFGGEDLIATLDSQKSTAVPNIGRYRDITGEGGSDWSGTFSQSLALLVMNRRDAVATDAVDFLVNLQCENGGFPYSPDAATARCSGNADADHDATSMALIAFSATGVRAVPGVDAAIAKAADYLVADQKSNGSFDAPPWVGPNANSTGLAASALRSVGRSEAADKAASWLATLQLDCANAASGVAASYRGAIAYDADSLSTALTSGVDSSTADQFRFAGTQAVLGFTGSDSFVDMSSAGASNDVPTLTCTQPRVAPSAPEIGGITYSGSLKSASTTVTVPAGVDALFRVSKGSSAAWSGWTPVEGSAFEIPASKTARYVEVIARDSGGDSAAVSLLVQARSSKLARKGCQAVGPVTVAYPSDGRASATFAERKSSCAGWRIDGKGRWKTVSKGATSVDFAVQRAVGANWELRTGRRMLSISVRTPR